MLFLNLSRGEMYSNNTRYQYCQTNHFPTNEIKVVFFLLSLCYLVIIRLVTVLFFFYRKRRNIDFLISFPPLSLSLPPCFSWSLSYSGTAVRFRTSFRKPIVSGSVLLRCILGIDLVLYPLGSNQCLMSEFD